MRLQFSKEFLEMMTQLDNSERIRVTKQLQKLEAAAKPFGKSLSGGLSGAFSVRTGNNSQMRIVYLPNNDAAMVLAVADRQNGHVYNLAAKIITKYKG